MKYLVFLLSLSANIIYQSNAADLEPYRTIREIIEQFLERLVDVLPEEIPLPDRDIAGPETGPVSTNVTLFNRAISGISRVDVNVEYSGVLVPVPRTVTIDYRRLATRSNYISRLILDLINEYVLETPGGLNAVILNTTLLGGIDFSLVPLTLQITELQLQVEEVEVEIEGLLGSQLLSRWASSILSENGADIINGSSDIIAPLVANIINRFLERYFPWTPNQNRNVDESSYTKEQLDVSTKLLKDGLDNILSDLQRLVN